MHASEFTIYTNEIGDKIFFCCLLQPPLSKRTINRLSPSKLFLMLFQGCCWMFCVAERFEVPETITSFWCSPVKKKKGLILDIRYFNLFVFQADIQARIVSTLRKMNILAMCFQRFNVIAGSIHIYQAPEVCHWRSQGIPIAVYLDDCIGATKDVQSPTPFSRVGRSTLYDLGFVINAWKGSSWSPSSTDHSWLGGVIDSRAGSKPHSRG